MSKKQESSGVSRKEYNAALAKIIALEEQVAMLLLAMDRQIKINGAVASELRVLKGMRKIIVPGEH